MIKRTLYFGNPAYLKTTNEQLVIEMHDSGEAKSTPIKDIGLLILDYQQITNTQSPRLEKSIFKQAQVEKKKL